jgi:replication factor C subunit 3/5
MIDLFHKYNKYDLNNFDPYIKERYKTILDIFLKLNYNNLPNILLYGNEGSGKKSLIYSFFKNPKKSKIINTYKFNGKEFKYIIYKTNNFIEIDIQELGIYKKYILRNIIKEFILTKNVIDNKNKIIIIHKIDQLDIDDQFILRKIIEDHIVNCRFILISLNINNLLESIKSRCLILKTPGFTKEIVSKKIYDIINIEKIKIEDDNLKYIINNSNNNLKKAILDLNTYSNLEKLNQKEFFIKLQYNTREITNDIINILKKQKINYEKLDSLLYLLLVNYNIPPTKIIKNIYKLIKDELDEDEQHKLIDLCYEYNKNLINSTKHIIYLQSFTYKIYYLLNKNKY